MISHSEKELLNEFWDIKDLSIYLKVKVKTLYAMLQEIPHYRIGKLIRFRKVEIDNWLEGKTPKIRDSKSEANSKKRKPLEKGNIHIDNLVRKAIDQTKEEGYNPKYGKPDHVKGLKGKEVGRGFI